MTDPNSREPFEQFVGDYDISIIVYGVYLIYKIYNSITLASFLYHGIPYKMDLQNGPAGEMKQYYFFIEPIDYNRL